MPMYKMRIQFHLKHFWINIFMGVGGGGGGYFLADGSVQGSKRVRVGVLQSPYCNLGLVKKTPRIYFQSLH